MDESKSKEKLDALIREFEQSERQGYKKVAGLAKQARDSNRQLKKSVNTLQESLDYLRLCIKYQSFDLEATRRENNYLRKLLSDKGGDTDR